MTALAGMAASRRPNAWNGPRGLHGGFCQRVPAAPARLTPVLKTQGVTLQLGARKAEIANATERRDALDTFIKAEMANNGGDYDRAFAAVQKANPSTLFAAMKQQPGSAIWLKNKINRRKISHQSTQTKTTETKQQQIKP